MGDPRALNDQLLIGEYQNEFDRKGRLHNKTLGYFVIELFELMISLTVTSLVFTIGDFQLSAVGIFVIVVALFSISYFFIWSLLVALKYYRNHRLIVTDIQELIGESSTGDIRNVLVQNTARNREINDRISKQNDVLYVFFIIDSMCFLFFVVVLALGVLKII